MLFERHEPCRCDLELGTLGIGRPDHDMADARQGVGNAEGGIGGGKVVSKGTPKKVAMSKRSRTAPFLKDMFRQ